MNDQPRDMNIFGEILNVAEKHLLIGYNKKRELYISTAVEYFELTGVDCSDMKVRMTEDINRLHFLKSWCDQNRGEGISELLSMLLIVYPQLEDWHLSFWLLHRSEIDSCLK